MNRALRLVVTKVHTGTTGNHNTLVTCTSLGAVEPTSFRPNINRSVDARSWSPRYTKQPACRLLSLRSRLAAHHKQNSDICHVQYQQILSTQLRLTQKLILSNSGLWTLDTSLGLGVESLGKVSGSLTFKTLSLRL